MSFSAKALSSSEVAHARRLVVPFLGETPFIAVLLVVFGCGVAIGGCSAAPPSSSESGASALFEDVAAESGLAFTHVNGMTGKFYQPEIMGSGAAVFDYDNDGDLDVLLVQGGRLGDGTPLMPIPSDPLALRDRLYRNDLTVAADGTRRLRFTDVTAESGIVSRGYGMGVAAGDIDNDGWIDLYLTGFGRNQLFRNNGNGTFSDVTAASGTGSPSTWGVPATLFDYDRDGLLDLFVGNYLSYQIGSHVPCFGTSGAPDYCRPSVYRAEPNRLYRNRGQGRFEDVTISAGMGRPFGPALGSIAFDANGDGWLDLFVANDEQENQLWLNQRGAGFRDAALLSGVALGPNGERKANMGVDAGDFDDDGDEDLVVTELINQGSTLYVNDGAGNFEEQSASRGVRRPTLPFTGFGTGWIDVDNDGRLDVLAVNGEVNQNVRTLAQKENPFPLGQRKLLLKNVGGRFEEASVAGGPVFDLVETGRGAAFGDLDNDGDTDVVVTNGAGPVRLLLNLEGSRHHWLGLRLVGSAGQANATPIGGPNRVAGGPPTPPVRDLTGAKVVVRRPNASPLMRRSRADGSYASSNDPRVLVGLGDSSTPVSVDVTWPDGTTSVFANVPVDRYTTLRHGAAP